MAPNKTYEGVPLASPARIVEILNDLITDAKNVVYIMSGSRPEELEDTFRLATGVGLIAENGCFLREYGASTKGWETFVNTAEVRRWKKDVKAILKYYVERLEHSYIEERRCSLLFCYDKVEDQDNATRQAGECADQINSSCKSMRIRAVPVPGAVLIEHMDFNKATAAAKIFEKLQQKSKDRGIEAPDFLVVAGDDRDDEVIFRWANKLAKKGEVRGVFTASVGKRNTEAQTAITQGSTGLLTILQKVSDFMKIQGDRPGGTDVLPSHGLSQYHYTTQFA